MTKDSVENITMSLFTINTAEKIILSWAAEREYFLPKEIWLLQNPGEQN